METLQPLTAALRAHRAPRLRALNLAWNRIADARPLAAVLAEGAAPLLSELKLDGNQLPDASAAALAAAFAGGAAPGLETLVLGTDRAGNLIGDEGMLALVDALCRGLPQLARRRAPSPPPQHAARTRPPLTEEAVPHLATRHPSPVRRVRSASWGWPTTSSATPRPLRSPTRSPLAAPRASRAWGSPAAASAPRASTSSAPSARAAAARSRSTRRSSGRRRTGARARRRRGSGRRPRWGRGWRGAPSCTP